MMMKPQTFVLALIAATSLGGVLRFAAIGGQSFWYDEAFGDALAARASLADIATGRARDNGLPPLYYVSDKIVADHFGTSELHHRFLPALFGMLSVPLLGLLARRLHSPEAGAAAAWLLAVSPLQVELADEARVYSFLHFITTLNALLFIRWLDSRSWANGLL